MSNKNRNNGNNKNNINNINKNNNNNNNKNNNNNNNINNAKGIKKNLDNKPLIDNKEINGKNNQVNKDEKPVKEIKEVKDEKTITSNIIPSTIVDEDEIEKDYTKPTKLEMEYIKAYKNKEFPKESFGVEEWLNPNILKIDKDTQRNVNLNQVTQIIKNFNPSSFGRLAVSKRDDGYYVTNGQHRLLASQKIGIAKVPCVVTMNEFVEEKDKKKQDAQQFLEINQNVTAVRAIDKYRIGVSAEMEDWLRVKEVIESNGLRAGTTVNSVNAVACIYRYINSPTSLDTINNKKRHMKWALKILKDTVGVARITNVSLQAMCIIVREYVDYDLTTVDKMISKLQDIKLNAMIGEAINMKNTGMRKNVVTYLAILIAKEYNKRCKKRTEKLPLNKLADIGLDDEDKDEE